MAHQRFRGGGGRWCSYFFVYAGRSCLSGHKTLRGDGGREHNPMTHHKMDNSFVVTNKEVSFEI
jgi:hypothetical protein